MQRFPFQSFRTVSALGALSLVTLLASACSSSDSISVASTNNLDCSEQSHVSAGTLEGHNLRGEAGLLHARQGDNWELEGMLDDFYFTATRSLTEDVAVGTAHFTSNTTAEQICVAKAEWVEPAQLLRPGGSAVLFSGFSTLGSCANADGPTQKLNFCSTYLESGSANCGPAETRIYGELDGTPIDERRQWLSQRQHASERTDSLDTHFVGGGRLAYVKPSNGS
ncbi:MAG: hypothetical protein R3B07_31855, partial [Polyangiaceae bacterium]